MSRFVSDIGWGFEIFSWVSGEVINAHIVDDLRCAVWKKLVEVRNLSLSYTYRYKECSIILEN